MDIYHIWCNLKPGHSAQVFARDITAYLGHLKDGGQIAGYRLTRRKLGFGPGSLGEFHVQIETENLTQLEQAFQQVAPRAGETERLHHAVYSVVENLQFALYRDFPDVFA